MQRFNLVLQILAALLTLIVGAIGIQQYRQSNAIANRIEVPPEGGASGSEAEPTSTDLSVFNPSARTGSEAGSPEGTAAAGEESPPPAEQPKPKPGSPRSFDVTVMAGEQQPVLGDRVGLAFSLTTVGHSEVPTLSISLPGGKTQDEILFAAGSRFSFSLDGSRWDVFVLSLDVREKVVHLRISRQ